MSKPKTDHRPYEKMTPEERESEHARRLREEVDAVKSGIHKSAQMAQKTDTTSQDEPA
jgi:hypothetical protein